MFHIHKWSKWEQFSTRMINVRTGREWSEDRQRRRCSTCGLVKSRPVTD